MLRIGHAPGVHQAVSAQDDSPLPGRVTVPYSLNTTSDTEGRFVFERVPATVLRISRVTGVHITGFSHVQKVEVKPGQTNQVILGGGGRKVIGRIRTVPENVVKDWTLDLQKLVLQTPGLVAPKREDFPDESAYWRAWGEYYFTVAKKYYLTVSQNGSFVVDDVPPGTYRLELSISAPPADPLDPERYIAPRRPIATMTNDVVIPEAPADRPEDPVDLRTVTVPIKTEPKAQDF